VVRDDYDPHLLQHAIARLLDKIGIPGLSAVSKGQGDIAAENETIARITVGRKRMQSAQEPVLRSDDGCDHAGQRAASERPVKIYVPGRATLSWCEFGPHRIIASFWNHRGLILQLCRREIAARYRGSVLGLAWSFITPLLMLAVYTFVFSTVFKARWDVSVDNKVEFALVLFAGLIVFGIFSECLSRAPSLLLENPSYIKRIIFPLESLAWVTLLSSLFNAIISVAILAVGFLLVSGMPPLTIFWLPVVLLPMSLMLLGLVWILASLGIYVRDVSQLVAIILPVFMFASPLFYPLSALPAMARHVLALSPLAFTMEQVRGVALFGAQPNLLGLAIFSVVGAAVAWLGLVWFLFTKRGFADVL
jgi:lipopolysaccharide transport system permease protein